MTKYIWLIKIWNDIAQTQEIYVGGSIDMQACKYITLQKDKNFLHHFIIVVAFEFV